jgi:hypothetical protein
MGNSRLGDAVGRASSIGLMNPAAEASETMRPAVRVIKI